MRITEQVAEGGKALPVLEDDRPQASTGLIGLAFLLFVVALWIAVYWGASVQAVRLVYPATMFIAGLVLYQVFPVAYVGFMWWVWFLTPMIRRIVDYQGGWMDPNPILLAPLLVTGISALTVLKERNTLFKRDRLPFFLLVAGILYGYVVGLAKVGLVSATLSLLEWLAPIFLGFHLAVNWKRYPSHRRMFEATFQWGVLVLGLYALLQFFVLLEWDRYWMIQSEMGSIGSPKPLRVRVFSTMNAPGPFAYVILPGLLLFLNGRRWMNLVAAVPGYTSFLLSLVRAAWGGLLVGIGAMAWYAGGRIRTRLITLVGVIILLTLPLLATDVIYDTVISRAETISNLEEDSSLKARLSVYRGVSVRILNMPLGFGLGASGSGQRVSGEASPVLDSGLMAIGLQLGWLGTLLYLVGYFQLLAPIVRLKPARLDPFIVAAFGVVMALSASMFFGGTHTGSAGCILFGFLGLIWAGGHYHEVREQTEVEPAMTIDYLEES